ncbi:copper homeostasis membrane protein CopD [Lichenihabitans sp. Uapishka_5]|uniref:copper homeostasis membrane protein CopD n=1 Tax=Lichenihabitans sp. Uapishka_5 TaxID=3037302 RepID=UPI0029E7DEDA|nr:copper homeostasis membrane protein CopD [Lichenihabitans sp. Uapishka_5]MDX7950898.1 copper homeostasis membrane protein CopD [Lichenihabitans sp. Uapishka_5]
MEIDTGMAVVRWLRDVPTLMLWGGGIYSGVLVPPALRYRLEPRFRPWQVLAAATAALSVAASLPLQAAALGGLWADALTPGRLADVLFETNLGPLWVAQAVAAAALLGLSLGRLPGRTAATAVVAGLLLAGVAAGGHAAMRAGVPGLLQRGATWLHLLAAGFWLGSLPLLFPILAEAARDTHGDAVLALRRFSTVGHAAVAGVLATGAINAALVLGHASGPGGLSWTDASPYRTLLALKIACALLMTALALLNRYGFLRQWIRGDGRAMNRIRGATLTEIGLGIMAVALVAVFGLLEPG